ncbi:metabolite-proton symporter [Tamaricihabitans halophyticus]|uniref:Putative proline/betaine transporter n=1 Tax=Tamaricihabitans halophyticus TaxID=1262583 RepID=A0A4R2PVT1_9PSEU|nr:MFS transporter [Tamaricihabitans halophyticus]TCP39364.1 metabolite-proton symporter [Tamaricihabitans halophyticus]
MNFPESATASTRKVIVGSTVGTTLEWYDFFLYGLAASLVFNRIFFPSFDPIVGTMLSFGSFAIAFVARPIGATVFGHLGDRLGRKRTLVHTLFLMGAATLGIGLLPTYDSIGVLAPVLLTALRFLQGISLGGEWAGAILMSSEHAGARRRGLAASWPQMGAPAGNLLAAGVMGLMLAIMPQQAFDAWGWRVPFLLSAALVLVGLWLRISVAESPAFREVEEPVKAPVLSVVREHPVRLLLAAGVRIGPDVSYYIWTLFIFTYAAQLEDVPRQLAVSALLVGSALQLVLVPLCGHLSDRFGRRRLYLVGGVGTALWGFAFFALLDTQQPVMVFIAAIGGLFFHAVMYGPQAALISELFPTAVRYSGVALGSQLSGIAGAAFAPLIAVALLETFENAFAVAVYVGACSALTVVAALLMPETTKTTLRETPASQEDLAQ